MSSPCLMCQDWNPQHFQDLFLSIPHNFVWQPLIRNVSLKILHLPTTNEQLGLSEDWIPRIKKLVSHPFPSFKNGHTSGSTPRPYGSFTVCEVENQHLK
jgi:hypothetical protein